MRQQVSGTAADISAGALKPPSSSVSPVLRAVLYLRVSTKKQADGEVSIPSQRDLCTRFAQSRGFIIVGEFIDAGSARDDRQRPQFRKMLSAATAGPPAFDVIVVHALHRWFRNGPTSELLIRDLRKRGVRIESVTQPLTDDPSSVMGRQMFGIFDEYSSLQNSINVERGMAENARQGFWNGARPPLGYRSVVAEQRGKKLKKRLEIEPVEAETVRTIFKLYADGLDGSPALGIADLVRWLNERGFRTRLEARFGKGPVGAILRAKYYASGEFLHGQKARNGETREPIPIPIPVLIPQDLFDRVQTKLDRNNPQRTPPRVVSSPVLLSGLARCAECGASMTRTATARGHRQYSYYTCAGSHVTALPECAGHHVPTEKLDRAVTTAVLAKLLEPRVLSTLLGELVDRRSQTAAEAQSRVAALKAVADECDTKLARLYRLVETGDAEPDTILKDRMKVLNSDRARAQRALAIAMSETAPEIVVDAERIGRFSHMVSHALREGDIQARRAYLQSIIDRIEVGRERVSIVGRKVALEAAVNGRAAANGNVRGFDREWRTREDSNL
jgi:site-specific DNA recombinase